MDALQRQMVSRVEQLLKLQTSDQRMEAQETPTCCLVLYKGKLLYRQEKYVQGK